MSRIYQIFDGIEESFNLRKVTGTNLRNVCEVMCQNKDLSDDNRLHYAKIGGIPKRATPEGTPYWSFDENFDSNTYFIGLVDKLFIDCPKLYDIDKDGKIVFRKKIQIGDSFYSGEELYGMMDVEAVYSALGFFLSRCGYTVHGLPDFLNLFRTIQTLNSLKSNEQEQPTAQG